MRSLPSRSGHLSLCRGAPSATLLQHELIHIKQANELGVIGFYASIFRLARPSGSTVAPSNPYRRIRFEQEAYHHQDEPNYLTERPPHAYAQLQTLESCLLCHITADTPHEYHKKVEAAQTLGGAGIIRIGKAHSEGGDYVGAARGTKDLYGYHLGDVVFKPTLAAEAQFRNDVEGALLLRQRQQSTLRMVALRLRLDGSSFQQHPLPGEHCSAMGNYFFTGPDGI